eukprot:1155474-Pelagomonas_calceolata.AAC.10
MGCRGQKQGLRHLSARHQAGNTGTSPSKNTPEWKMQAASQQEIQTEVQAPLQQEYRVHTHIDLPGSAVGHTLGNPDMGMTLGESTKDQNKQA